MMIKARLALALACSLVASACGADRTDETPAAAVADAGRLVDSDGSLTALEGEYRDVARLAVRTLAEALSLPENEIVVDTVKPVDWSDTSIGCPQPGYSYGQVITPGHRIALRTGGRLHFVHEASGRAIVCDAKRTVGGIGSDGRIVWGEQAAAARADLATRLRTSEEDINIVGARSRTWPDSGLGCGESSASASTGEVDGFVLILRHGGRTFTYHTDLDRVIPCPAITED
jgi:hypothetical protein